MNRAHKQLVAEFVIDAVGDRLEFLSEYVSSGQGNPELLEIDRDEMLKVIAQWLSKLPGEHWHNGLPSI